MKQTTKGATALAVSRLSAAHPGTILLRNRNSEPLWRLGYRAVASDSGWHAWREADALRCALALSKAGGVAGALLARIDARHAAELGPLTPAERAIAEDA